MWGNGKSGSVAHSSNLVHPVLHLLGGSIQVKRQEVDQWSYRVYHIRDGIARIILCLFQNIAVRQCMGNIAKIWDRYCAKFAI